MIYTFCSLNVAFWKRMSTAMELLMMAQHDESSRQLVVEAKKVWQFYWVCDALIEPRLTNSSNFIDWQWHIASTYGLPLRLTPNSVPHKSASIHQTRRLNLSLNGRAEKKGKGTFSQSIWVTRRKYEKNLMHMRDVRSMLRAQISTLSMAENMMQIRDPDRKKNVSLHTGLIWL